MSFWDTSTFPYSQQPPEMAFKALPTNHSWTFLLMKMTLMSLANYLGAPVVPSPVGEVFSCHWFGLTKSLTGHNLPRWGYLGLVCSYPEFLGNHPPKH